MTRKPFWGIIRHMAEMKDMYRIVKFAYSKDIPSLVKLKAPKESEAALKLSEAYLSSLKKYHRKPHKAQLAKLIHSAHIEESYLRTVGKTNAGLHLEVTRKGIHLIAKKFHFFRVGLWDESLKSYGTTVALFAGGGIGAILLYIIQLIFGH
jgi:hypothetical protein